jgi:mycoredoxin-dependent peroxiredoxin
MTIVIGQTAPAFSLKDQSGEMVSLSDYAGTKAVALVFYPFTFTGVCEGELCQLRDDFSDFTDAGVQVLACSCDSPFAQKQWAAQQGYQFPVLSDFWPHGEVAKAYGVFDDTRGCAIRATFVIDKSGVVVDTFQTPDLGTAREKSRYEEALAKL